MKPIVQKIPVLHNLAHRVRTVKSMVQGRYRISRLAKASLPLRIVVGASGVHDDGWIATDIGWLNVLRALDWNRFFSQDSIDAILAEHVWEHLTMEDGFLAAQLCFQYLKPGGYLRLAVPDGYHPDPEYIEWVRQAGIGPGSDDHKVLYNYVSLRSLFERAGFRVKLLEYFDADGEFHFENWDPSLGKIYRSKRFDERNTKGILKYTSIILDAYKNT